MRRLAKALFFLAALPAVLRAAVRCAWLAHRLPLGELVERLRSVPAFGIGWLARPGWLLATVDRTLPLLPPWRYGRCLKRSLLLLDLWARCGLRPRLHLGVRREGERGRHQGHAWVTDADAAAVLEECAVVSPGLWPWVGEGEMAPATSSQGYAEAFRF